MKLKSSLQNKHVLNKKNNKAHTLYKKRNRITISFNVKNPF